MSPGPDFRRWLRAVSLLLVMTAGAAEAKIVDPVPLPLPRPAGSPTAVSSPAVTAPDPVATAVSTKPAAKPKLNPNSRFSASQQQALFAINAYFNSFRTMEGKFIQVGPHGEQSEGIFYIARPGRIRFHYSPPVKLDVIADGKNVAIRDNRTMTQDYYPLSKTPLRYLLADDIDLTSEKLVSDVREEQDLVALVIIETLKLVKGKITLIFDRKTHDLKQWIVTDAQGLNTSVAIYDVHTGKPQDPGLFKINYMQPR